MFFARLAARSASLPRPTWTAPRVQHLLRQRVLYSTASGLSRETIQERILTVFKDFEKVDPVKVSRVLFRQKDDS